MKKVYKLNAKGVTSMQQIFNASVFSCFISLIIGKKMLPLLRDFELGQYIREDVPENHKKKQGVPTFGGLIFIFGTIITLLFAWNIVDKKVIFIATSFIIFGTVGFIDDSLKKLHKHNEGLNKMQKTMLLLIAANLCSFYIYNNFPGVASIIIPFNFGNISLGGLSMPFMIFFYMCMTNAVNLTDGLDGLAAIVTILVVLFFTLISLIQGNYSVALFCGILSGALLGFLRYNIFPAKIIMGDTGALALGGVLASIAIVTKMPLIIAIVGGIYVIEALTTFIQIMYFKLTKKRFFPMAPIHHSFELAGWEETKIVSMFSILTLVMCLIGMIAVIK